MILALLLLPALAAMAAFFIRPDTPRRVLLVVTACAQAALTAVTWVVQPAAALDGWLRLDGLGQLFLSIKN